jgi:hypothetical protein
MKGETIMSDRDDGKLCQYIDNLARDFIAGVADLHLDDEHPSAKKIDESDRDEIILAARAVLKREEKKPDKIIAALKHLTAAAEAVEQLWDHTGTNMIDGYPKCLPSFDEFVGEVREWARTQEEIRTRPASEPITILQVAARRLGVPEDSDFTGEQLASVGLEILGGCAGCEATIAIYNAYPARSGHWHCKDCIGNWGFYSVEEFESARPESMNRIFPDVDGSEGRNVKLKRCDCGRDVECCDFTNTCECGADYNWAGQRLAPREQWGEETGEHYSDILRIK